VSSEVEIDHLTLGNGQPILHNSLGANDLVLLALAHGSLVCTTRNAVLARVRTSDTVLPLVVVRADTTVASRPARCNELAMTLLQCDGELVVRRHVTHLHTEVGVLDLTLMGIRAVQCKAATEVLALATVAVTIQCNAGLVLSLASHIQNLTLLELDAQFIVAANPAALRPRHRVAAVLDCRLHLEIAVLEGVVGTLPVLVPPLAEEVVRVGIAARPARHGPRQRSGRRSSRRCGARAVLLSQMRVVDGLDELRMHSLSITVRLHGSLVCLQSLGSSGRGTLVGSHSSQMCLLLLLVLGKLLGGNCLLVLGGLGGGSIVRVGISSLLLSDDKRGLRGIHCRLGLGLLRGSSLLGSNLEVMIVLRPVGRSSLVLQVSLETGGFLHEGGDLRNAGGIGGKALLVRLADVLLVRDLEGAIDHVLGLRHTDGNTGLRGAGDLDFRGGFSVGLDVSLSLSLVLVLVLVVLDKHLLAAALVLREVSMADRFHSLSMLSLGITVGLDGGIVRLRSLGGGRSGASVRSGGCEVAGLGGLVALQSSIHRGVLRGGDLLGFGLGRDGIADFGLGCGKLVLGGVQAVLGRSLLHTSSMLRGDSLGVVALSRLGSRGLLLEVNLRCMGLVEQGHDGLLANSVGVDAGLVGATDVLGVRDGEATKGHVLRDWLANRNARLDLARKANAFIEEGFHGVLAGKGTDGTAREGQG